MAAKETKKSLAKFFHNIPSNYEVNLSRVFTVLFVDIDECKQENICKNGRCMNDPGSFKCVCDRGFTPSSDGKACLGKIAGPLLLVFYNCCVLGSGTRRRVEFKRPSFHQSKVLNTEPHEYSPVAD